MASSRGQPRPKAYLSIAEYLRKAGAFKTVNVYYNEIISTHPSVALSENGDTEDVDELAQGMIRAAQHGHLETLKFLAGKVQTGGEQGGMGTCIGERVGCLMLHVAAEAGHDSIVHYLVEDLWVDVDEATVRGMTALHYAAKANRTAVVRELARLGADLEAKNDAGQVPAQLTKDRLLRRLFQQYLGGRSWGPESGAMVDRFVPPSASRVVDYVAVMTVKLAPQMRADRDELADTKKATVAELCRFPQEDHEDAPMADPSNLAEICTQTCGAMGGPLVPYGTLLTDPSGARSYVCCKVLGVYQDAAQRGRARVHTALGPPPGEREGFVPAGEVSTRVVIVLARHPFTGTFAAICEHLGELILDEALKWGSLAEWPLDPDHERNHQIRFCMEHYATELPRPLTSAEVEHTVLGRVLKYGDAHASHTSLPHLEDSDVSRLTSLLGPDTILLTLSCLLQEQSVLLLSDRVEDLAPATSALLGLLFPLRWPHTLIPVLPASLVHYLEAPVPFLMGMHRKELDKVNADLSCITMVNLTTNSVVLPIRPITSVSTVVSEGAGGQGTQRKPGRRDSLLRSLAELPTALKRRAENRIRRCVPLKECPVSDRTYHQPRVSSLYTPGIRIAVADVMVDLFGAYQTYRYVEGAQKRMISEAPEDHRSLLQAVYSTQLWRMFSDDLLAEEPGVNGENWEEQAQLFCACVERARHEHHHPQGDVAGPDEDSHSCQDVLYPSEDVEEKLAQLTVYPEPDENPSETADAAATEGGDEGRASGEQSIPVTDSRKTPAPSPGASSPSGSPPLPATAAATAAAFQEKTDEVLRSITGSLASMTDMFSGLPAGGGGAGSRSGKASRKGGVPDGGSPAEAGAPQGGAMKDRFGNGEDDDEDAGAVVVAGWDLFKPPSMADVKRRLEDMKVGGGGLSLSPPKVPASSSQFEQEQKPGTATGARTTAPTPTGLSVRRGRAAGGTASLSPPKAVDPGAAAAAGLAKFGEGWRDFRRRSTEAVEEAVTKLKTALDDSDDEDAADARVAARIAEKARVRAKAKAEKGVQQSDGDAFWRPFGEAAVEGVEEAVPLPSAEEVRRGRAARSGRSPVAARRDLDAYYGGGGGDGDDR